MRVGAIVNTTNEEMIGYGGVDLAIHAIAGAELDTECAKLAPLDLGQAQITGGSQVRNLHLRTCVVGGFGVKAFFCTLAISNLSNISTAL